MGVRRQCNRYSTSPWGPDEATVIRRAKQYYNYFPYEFILVKKETMSGDLFFAHSPSLHPFKNPDGAILYKKVDGRWRKLEK